MAKKRQPEASGHSGDQVLAHPIDPATATAITLPASDPASAPK
jgi:hypothetical protein